MWSRLLVVMLILLYFFIAYLITENTLSRLHDEGEVISHVTVVVSTIAAIGWGIVYVVGIIVILTCTISQFAKLLIRGLIYSGSFLILMVLYMLDLHNVLLGESKVTDKMTPKVFRTLAGMLNRFKI